MVNILKLSKAQNRIEQGLGDLAINMIKYPHVFKKINTDYPRTSDDLQTRIMELATHPMGDPEAAKILELLCGT